MRRLSTKLASHLGRGPRAGLAVQASVPNVTATVHSSINQAPALSPEAAIRRLVAEPDSVEALKAIGDALSAAGQRASARPFYTAYLEHRSNDVDDDQVRRLILGDPSKPVRREVRRDDRFVYDPEYGINTAVIAAIE